MTTATSGSSTANPDSSVAHPRQDDVAVVRQTGDFEAISIVDSPTDRRYGTALRARATVDGDERAFALLFLDPDIDDHRRFVRALSERLDVWHGLDAAGVATVHDYGTRPGPWVATDYADRTLSDVDRLPLDRALGFARRLARGMVAIHEAGLAHGGVDSHSVGLGDGLLDGDSRPRLDDVGLFEPFREHAGSGSYLDSRYAAPEHFRGGTLDQATDVYGLGAVVYRLTTGRPPYEGSVAEVRKAVVGSSPIPPSDRPELPAALDDVIAKALSTQKLTRYETARQLLADLRRI